MAELSSKEKKENKSQAKILIFIFVLIVILMIAGVSIFLYIKDIQKNNLKVIIDDNYYSVTSVETNLTNRRFASDAIILEDNVKYYSIRDFAGISGFKYYRGNKISEDETKGYIENETERVVFTTGSKEIKKYSLLSSEGTKISGGNAQLFDIKDNIIFKNKKLYINEQGLERALNILIQDDPETKRITMATMDYTYSLLARKIPDLFVDNNSKLSAKSVLENKKALLYGFAVVYDQTTGLYGMKYVQNPKDIVIGKKYKSITYIEKLDDFLVVTEGNKVGIVGKDASSKITPNYDLIETIDTNQGLYLVKSNNKYGVINQNGNSIVSVDYQMIGLDDSVNDSNVDNKYLLYGTLIPVKYNDKWGFFDYNKNEVVKPKYDFIGCSTLKNAEANAQPISIVPEINGIVVGLKTSTNVSSDVNYGLINRFGELMIEIKSGSAYKVSFNNETKYYFLSGNTSVDVVKFWKDYVKSLEATKESNTNTVENTVAAENSNNVQTPEGQQATSVMENQPQNQNQAQNQNENLMPEGQQAQNPNQEANPVIEQTNDSTIIRIDE